MIRPVDISLGEWSDTNCDKLMEKMRAKAEEHPGTVVAAGCGAWSVGFSVSDRYGNIFSACVRRSTSERDWRILGRMARRIGAPEEAMPETIANDATATHYYVWGGPAPAETRSKVQKLKDLFFRR